MHTIPPIRPGCSLGVCASLNHFETGTRQEDSQSLVLHAQRASALHGVVSWPSFPFLDVNAKCIRVIQCEGVGLHDSHRLIKHDQVTSPRTAAVPIFFEAAQRSCTVLSLPRKIALALFASNATLAL